MTRVFIGIETPNVESLQETKKRQNVGVDLIDQIQVFLDHGIAVIAGMIVGFDNDGRHLRAPVRLRHGDAGADLHASAPWWRRRRPRSTTAWRPAAG